MWAYRLVANLRRHRILEGLANIMIFAGMIGCVVGGFLFMITPLVTWLSMAVFIGGFCVLAHSDKYLSSKERNEEF